jgi:hypothetical protein
MKKIYITDPATARTLNFLHRQAEETLGRDRQAGAQAAVQLHAYIFRTFPEARTFIGSGLWNDEKGMYVACFTSQAEHAAFVAEILAAGKMSRRFSAPTKRWMR